MCPLSTGPVRGKVPELPLLRRALRESRRRGPTMEDGLDVVAVGVVYERSVVVLVVVGPQPGRTVVLAASCGRSLVERVHGRTVRALERDVDGVRLALPDREHGLALGAESTTGPALELHQPIAERLQRLLVELLTPLIVTDRDDEVVEHRPSFRAVDAAAGLDFIVTRVFDLS